MRVRCDAAIASALRAHNAVDWMGSCSMAVAITSQRGAWALFTPEQQVWWAVRVAALSDRLAIANVLSDCHTGSGPAI